MPRPKKAATPTFDYNALPDDVLRAMVANPTTSGATIAALPKERIVALLATGALASVTPPMIERAREESTALEMATAASAKRARDTERFENGAGVAEDSVPIGTGVSYVSDRDVKLLTGPVSSLPVGAIVRVSYDTKSEGTKVSKPYRVTNHVATAPNGTVTVTAVPVRVERSTPVKESRTQKEERYEAMFAQMAAALQALSLK